MRVATMNVSKLSVSGTVTILCIVTFILQLYVGEPLYDILMFNPSSPMTYFTPSLMHGGLIHIVLNLIAFYFIGLDLEKRIGKVKFIFLVLASSLISNAAQGFIVDYRFVGLSGVVFAICAYLMVDYHFKSYYKIKTTTLWRLSMTIQILGWLGFGFFFNYIVGDDSPVYIANMAHLYGLLTGAIFAMVSLNQQYPLKQLKQRK